ncbi:MAG: TlpA disulfide reductase family protein, partial [Spirochaetaceae bacterium]
MRAEGTFQQGAGGPGASEFTLESLEGEAFLLRDARGTPVVLNFRATWCGPCEAGPGAVRDYVEEHEIAYPVVLD